MGKEEKTKRTPNLLQFLFFCFHYLFICLLFVVSVAIRLISTQHKQRLSCKAVKDTLISHIFTLIYTYIHTYLWHLYGDLVQQQHFRCFQLRDFATTTAAKTLELWFPVNTWLVTDTIYTHTHTHTHTYMYVPIR